MTRINLTDFEKKECRPITTALTLWQFIQVNFLGWGFYNAQKINNRQYLIFDTFTGQLLYKLTA